MKATRNFLLFSVILLAILIININPSLIQNDYQNNDILIDCSKSKNLSKSMVGFLHSINMQSPSTKLITDLSPSYWRLSYRNGAITKRVQSFGAKAIFILSDPYKYPKQRSWRSPATAPNNWTDTVKHVLKKQNDENSDPIYDIWNEPNHKEFWEGTQYQFFDAFKKAYEQIRSMPNGDAAMVSGPSCANFEVQYIQNFLDYCLENNIRLDILSWHEFRTGNDIAKVADDISIAKSQFVNNPKYAALHIKSVQINEIIHHEDQFSPGSILGYFFYLEKGGVDGACKACWDESNGKSNCFNNSLDGLLTQNTLQPRSAWWVYKYYNQSLKNRFSSVCANNNIVCFSSAPSKNKVQVLVGYYGNKDRSETVNNIKLNITNASLLALGSNVIIKVSAIPNTGEDELTAPKPISKTTRKIIKGNLNIAIPQLNVNDAYLVEISAAI
jgi:hypothetical protein